MGRGRVEYPGNMGKGTGRGDRSHRKRRKIKQQRLKGKRNKYSQEENGKVYKQDDCIMAFQDIVVMEGRLKMGSGSTYPSKPWECNNIQLLAEESQKYKLQIFKGR